MLAEERRQRMVEMVAENATVSVAEFANLFDTSESTIRRDLDRLEAAGLLVKVHGGAASVETALTPAPFVAVEPTMAEKRDLHTPEKHVLAAWAAAQIQPDDFVYLDSGSTTQAIVEHLSDTACLATFVTNSVSLALALANRGARTIVSGHRGPRRARRALSLQLLQGILGRERRHGRAGLYHAGHERGHGQARVDEARP